MKPKTIITIVLIAFVAVSAVWLITSEMNKPAPAKTTVAQDEKPAEVSEPDTATMENATQSQGSTTDISKTESPTSEEPKVAKEEPKKEKAKVVVTFFQTTHKCASCIIIEKFTSEALNRFYTRQLADGTVQYQTINVDEPGNEHYVDEYQLVSKTLVISLYQGKKEVKWKNLMEIWNLLNNEEGFVQLVKDTIDGYLASGGLS